MVSARVGFGGCPTFTSVAWNSQMGDLVLDTKIYMHYIDTLIYNGYTLGKLLIDSEYAKLDCFFSGQVIPKSSDFTSTVYNNLLAYGTSAVYPWRAGIPYWELSTTTFIV